MRFVRVASAVAFAAIVALPALAAEVTGKWKAEFDTQIGIQKYVFDLKVDGETVTGTASFERMGEPGKAEIKEGKLEGADVFFVEIFAFDGDEIRIEYRGKVLGDEIKFVRSVGTFATEELVAKRISE